MSESHLQHKRHHSVCSWWMHFIFFFPWNALIVLGTSVPPLGTKAAGFLPPTSLSQIRHPISERLMNSRRESRSHIDVLPLIVALRLMSCSISCSRRAADSHPLLLILLIPGRRCGSLVWKEKQMISGRSCTLATIKNRRVNAALARWLRRPSTVGPETTSPCSCICSVQKIIEKYKCCHSPVITSLHWKILFFPKWATCSRPAWN